MSAPAFDGLMPLSVEMDQPEPPRLRLDVPEYTEPVPLRLRLRYIDVESGAAWEITVEGVTGEMRRGPEPMTLLERIELERSVRAACKLLGWKLVERS